MKNVLQNPEGNIQSERPKSKQDNIKMDIKDLRFEDVDRVRLIQDRDLWWALVGTI